MPNLIEMPFNAWSKGALKRGKKATTRHSKKGEPGDYFKVGVHYYVLTDIEKIPLRMVAEKFWKIEGARSKLDFIKVWNSIYPRMQYAKDPEREVWLHKFDKVMNKDLILQWEGKKNDTTTDTETRTK